MTGKSGSIEFVPIETKLGGNGPLMANALLAFNHPITYIGALGKLAVNPIYTPMTSKCEKFISISDPGITDCLEFKDGKIMCNTSVVLKDVNYQNLQKLVTPVEFRKMIGSTQLIGFTNYAKLPNYMTLFAGFSTILSQLNRKVNLFVDLADISIKTKEDLLQVSETLKKMNEFTHLYLGLN